ncbi:endonuclease/exonuclease/phosphatase family protein [Muricauda sp. CAU 1633]|uniref:endonuclease/exonuclease/phosphatase family protein n=1 Tax=Allomuricauda sp. CAU 1633 TaxID=2816036 RepID=UPI001A8F6625|nr:endonuclease/exonuclease/phosphatase family protein [Muricauda sp. CAU 1633]MBO0322118.1 endonuclease/exonuclease/phosphatase family protein [Muricauda sp. CAU 1633]
MFSVLSLFVPLLFALNLLFAGYWIYKRKKKFLLSLITLMIGYVVFGSFYGMGNEAGKAESSDLKIMTYNVRGFNKNEWSKDSTIGNRIIRFIKDRDPDILCIQEHDSRSMRYKQLNQYPYGREIRYSPAGKSAQTILSKYEIVGHGSLDLPDTANNIVYADILYGKDTVRIYNLHLQSFKIIPSAETFSEGQSEKNYRRLVSTFDKQLEQAKIFDAHRKQSPYATILCGDFNNTQFSNVYKIVKGNLTDTFLEKGEGFGRTYNLWKIPLRIDYILTEPNYQVISHTNFNEKLSDHYPVMATLRIASLQ